jgi:hypothetical protein
VGQWWTWKPTQSVLKLCRSDYLVMWSKWEDQLSCQPGSDHVSSFLVQVFNLFFSNFWIGQILVDKLRDNTLDLLQCYQVDKTRFNLFIPLWFLEYAHMMNYQVLWASTLYSIGLFITILNKGCISALVGQEFQPRDKVIWGNNKQDGKNNKSMASSWSSLEAKFLVLGFEVAQKT